MMVFALSGSVPTMATCRDSKVAQFKVVRSMGLSRLGLMDVIASRRLVLGLFLHSASSAKPNEVSASPYMTCSPSLATEYPNSHITVLIESAAVSTSFSYLSQLKVARFNSPARHRMGPKQTRNSSAPGNLMIQAREGSMCLTRGANRPDLTQCLAASMSGAK